MHWNLGAAFLENKLNIIESAIRKYNPDIIGISEGNLRFKVDLLSVNIEGYKLETVDAINNPEIGMSRMVTFIRNDVKYVKLVCKVF